MSIKKLRTEAIENAITQIEAILDEAIDVPGLEAAKQILMGLCEKSELFPRDEFPIPDNGLTERTFLVHENKDGGYALYVNSGIPGQSSPAHNHGGSWAMVAAISGEETHRLYVEEAENTKLDTAKIRQVTELTVKPGTAVSMMPEGIHSIHAGDNPLLHLHLYGKSFQSQSERQEFNLETGEVRSFVLEDVGFIEDAR
jgi:predicted metal-dependent enzyme (double-stranded beta helix superfamily)